MQVLCCTTRINLCYFVRPARCPDSSPTDKIWSIKERSPVGRRFNKVLRLISPHHQSVELWPQVPLKRKKIAPVDKSPVLAVRFLPVVKSSEIRAQKKQRRSIIAVSRVFHTVALLQTTCTCVASFCERGCHRRGYLSTARFGYKSIKTR
jgi:hypothetical protein